MSTDQEVKLLLEQVKAERAEIKADGAERQAEFLKWLLPTYFGGLIATGGVVLAIVKLMTD